MTQVDKGGRPQHMAQQDEKNGAFASAPGSDRAVREGGVERRDTVFSATWGVFVLALACCLLWGSAFPCIKVGYRLFSIASDDTASRLLFAGVRFAIAGLMVILAFSLMRRKPLLPRRGDWGPIVALSLTQTSVQYAFFYTGLAHASGVSSSIISASSSFFSILLAALVFRRERLTARSLLGCAIGFAGVVLVNLTADGLGGGFAWNGEGAILMSALSGALSTCLIAVFGKEHDPVLLSGWQFLLGGVTLTVAGLAGGGTLAPSGPQAIALLGYMGFISAAAYTIWSLLLQHNPVSRVSVFKFMNPVLGAVLSAVILREALSVPAAQVMAALALVSAGILVVNRKS